MEQAVWDLVTSPGLPAQGYSLGMRSAVEMNTISQNEDFESDGPLIHPMSRAFFRHWEASRGARACPTRDSFSLAPIQHVMPNMFVLDRDQLAGTFRYRLAGTRITEIFRTSLTGRDLLEGWDAHERAIIMRSLVTTANALQPSALRMRLSTNTRQAVGVEIVAVPVESRDSSHVQLMGGLFAFCDVNAITYDHIVARELVSNRLIWTEHGNPSIAASVASEQLEVPSNGYFAGQSTGQARRSFRVIRGGVA
jgi:hypothetical protein